MLQQFEPLARPIGLLGVITLGTVTRDRDKTLCLATDCIRFRARRMDTLVDKELFDKVATERYTGTARPSQPIT